VDLETSIARDIEQALQQRCSCNFSSLAIYSGEFSCQTTTTEVVYRAIINGSSESRTATELVDFMENWLESDGTLLYNKFRLRLTQNCSLRIESFSEEECGGDQDTVNENRADEGRDHKVGGMLLGSNTCYRFQSCGNDNNAVGSGDESDDDGSY
jgi:hypothetical protein